MSIFQTLFAGNSNPAPAQPLSPQQSANPSNPAANNPSGANQPGQPLPNTHASNTAAPNGVVPANPEGNPAAPVSPLDTFKDIWQTPANTDPNANAPMFANVDPQKLMESARQVDFTKAITPEVWQKIQAGGPDAGAALAQALNSAVQTSYAQSALATTKIVEQALAKQKEQFDAQLPSAVRKLSSSEAVMANNPVYQNPAVQPLVEAAKEMFLRKNPNATSAEIADQVGQYFQALGTTFAPKPAASSSSTKSPEVDWSKFLE